MESIILALLGGAIAAAFALGPVMILSKGATSEAVEGKSFLLGVASSFLLAVIAIIGKVHITLAQKHNEDEMVVLLILVCTIGVAGGILGHLWHEYWEKKYGAGRPDDWL